MNILINNPEELMSEFFKQSHHASAALVTPDENRRQQALEIAFHNFITATYGSSPKPDNDHNPNTLPSNFQPQDECYVRFVNGSYLSAIVTAVKFTNKSVLYDLDIKLDLLPDNTKRSARVHGVPGDLLCTVECYTKTILGRQLIGSGDLASFGRYLLSDTRTELIKNNTDLNQGTVEERLKEVYHADIENWRSTPDSVKDAYYNSVHR